MKKLSKFIKRNLHWFIVGGVALVCLVLLIVCHPSKSGEYLTLDGNDAKISEATEEFIAEAKAATIEYAKEAIPAVVINDEGEEEKIEVPTIESIDGGKIEHDDECNEEECGLGAYIYAPTDTYQHFKDYTYGKCWNIDSFAGAQCWDLSSLHAMNYTANKRVFSTCGTGAAKGMWNCKEQNAGSEYDLVYSINNVKVGDILVFGGGTYGHTGIAAGPVTNGYIALLGQNQGGSACPGGGSSTNIINISVKNFLGAFHPKTYVDPTPTPEPTPTPTPAPTPSEHKSGDKVEYSYVKGDFFSGVLVRLGLDDGNLWGENGTVRYYTEQLIEQDMLDSRGNVKLHTPFTLVVR